MAASIAAVQSSIEVMLSSVRATLEYGMDGRSFSTARDRQWNIRRSQFSLAENNPRSWKAWYFNQFRCSKHSFDKIVEMIEKNWHFENPAIGCNARYSIRWRVAAALNYLKHAGSIVDSANAFSMSKSSAWRFIEDVIRVLVEVIGPRVVTLPTSLQEWETLSDGFEAVSGFTDTCLAIDGVLIEIDRPFDYEGWYCRKGFPAINALAAVDHLGKIRDYALRPGSENDQGVYNRSNFGSSIQHLPSGKVIVADAGYQLLVHCMTPYPIENASREERLYNYLHSTTRIKVEQAFGRLKTRFRVFKSPLAQRGNMNNGDHPEEDNRHGFHQAARIIRCCFILHNIFIDLKDEVSIPESLGDQSDDNTLNQNISATAGMAAKSRRNSIKAYLNAKASM